MSRSKRDSAGVPQMLTTMMMVVVVAVVVAAIPTAVSADPVLRCAYHNITVPVEDNVTEDCKIESPGHGPSFCFVLFSRNKVSNEYEVGVPMIRSLHDFRAVSSYEVRPAPGCGLKPSQGSVFSPLVFFFARNLGQGSVAGNVAQNTRKRTGFSASPPITHYSRCEATSLSLIRAAGQSVISRSRILPFQYAHFCCWAGTIRLK